MAEQIHWHVLGAGAIGCLFAAALRDAGRAVELIVRGDEALAELARNGGVTIERDGRALTIPISGALPHKIQAPITHLLVCTKAQQTRAALRPLAHKLDSNTVIVLLQNGMGVREQTLQAFPDATVLHAITTAGAYRRDRFHIVHAGAGETLLGALDDADAGVAKTVAAALDSALHVQAVDNIARRLWLKLAINSVINPLTALHNRRNGELLDLADIDTTIANLCSEFAAVAAAEHHAFDSEELIAQVMSVIRATAANRSSMLQDMQAGRRTEIEYINGFLVRKGVQHGISCPQHIALYDAIRNREHAFS